MGVAPQQSYEKQNRSTEAGKRRHSPGPSIICLGACTGAEVDANPPFSYYSPSTHPSDSIPMHRRILSTLRVGVGGEELL